MTLDVRLTMFWDFNYAPVDSGEVIQVLGTFAVVPVFENLNKEKPNFPLFFPSFFSFFSFSFLVLLLLLLFLLLGHL